MSALNSSSLTYDACYKCWLFVCAFERNVCEYIEIPCMHYKLMQYPSRLFVFCYFVCALARLPLSFGERKKDAKAEKKKKKRQDKKKPPLKERSID